MIAIRKIIKLQNHRLIIDLPDLIDSEEVEVIIMPIENGKPVSVEDSGKISRKDLCGLWKGKIWMSPDFDEPLEDFREYM